MRELTLLYRLFEIYSRERPDVVHHFTVKCVVYGGLVAKAIGVRGVVSAITGMGYVFSSPSLGARLLRPIVLALLRAANLGSAKIIVQNTEDLDVLDEQRIASRARIRLIPSSGVNVSRFIPRMMSTGDNGTNVLFVGRLLRDKGVLDFVRAATRLIAEGVDASFLAAGEIDPGNPGSISATEVRMAISSGVQFLGHVDDMPALLSRARLVVLPSYYSEGVPRSLIEAAAAGLPIITTDMPGCRDVVVHGVNGLLVKPRDDRALADAIRKLLCDRALLDQMGAASREIALAKFDERDVIRKTLSVYEEFFPSQA
jgi:glycosyltransferase involved in cell wall biosynthesis